MQPESKTKWDRENTTVVTMKLNNKTDADILEKLSSVPSKQGYIKELIRGDIASRWIPCSERLPEYYDEYLVTLESPQMLIIGIAEYEPDEMLVAGGKWYLDDYDRVHSGLQVIAWMSLPMPYKDGDVK